VFRKHPAIGRKVLVNLFSGNAIEGVLTHSVGNQFILRAALVHEPGSDATPRADGEIVIDAANVDYIQML
jgi:small nuclear ribonucleoprotein (snRNP)-like protein